MAEWYDNALEYVADRTKIDELLPVYKKSNYSKSIPLDQLQSALADGWVSVKEYKKVAKVEREKSRDDVFEDSVWLMLANMGFSYLSCDRHNFKVQVDSDDYKQIDVFGIDEEVVVLAECKSAAKLGTNREFRQEIAEIEKYKSSVPRYLNKHFTNKPKYLYFFCTENYSVSEEDQNRMKKADIIWFDKRKIDYYSELTNQLGVLAKYQFLGEILQGKNIPGMSSMQVPAIKAKLGNYDCYTMMVEPKKLLKICFVLHRTDKVDMKNTYQRYVKKNRICQIKEYIENGGFFPNSIILNFDEDLLFNKGSSNLQTSENCSVGTLTLPAKYRSAFIIDGQHRLYGYAGTKSQDNSVIPVVAFRKVSPEDQTKMFVDINNKAVSVKRSLIESLNGELYWNSRDPKYALYALRSMLTIKLATNSSSPLLGCIKLGDKKESGPGSITLTYFIDNALKNEKYFVREFHKNGTPVSYGPLYDGDLADNSLNKGYVVLSNYFSQIKDACPEQWEYLLTNVCISTLSQLLCEFFCEQEKLKHVCYNNLKAKAIIPTVQHRIDALCNGLAKKSIEDILRFQKGKLGYGGVSKMKPHFERIIYDVDPSFAPDNLEKWIVEQSGEYKEKTKKMIDSLRSKILGDTVNYLRTKFGDQYYALEMPISVIKRMKERKDQDPNRECLIEFADVREIALADWRNGFDSIVGDKSKKGDKNVRTEYLTTIENVHNRIERGDTISEEQYNEISGFFSWCVYDGSYEV